MHGKCAKQTAQQYGLHATLLCAATTMAYGIAVSCSVDAVCCGRLQLESSKGISQSNDPRKVHTGHYDRQQVKPKSFRSDVQPTASLHSCRT